MDDDLETGIDDTVGIGEVSRKEPFTFSVNPKYDFYLYNSKRFMEWPGLARNITLNEPSIVLATYQTSSPAGGGHIISALFVDDHEQKQSRSVVGNTKYGSTFGFFVDELGQGKHTLSLKYRGTSNGALFQGGSDWQTRALSLVAVPEAVVHTISPRWEFRLHSANTWSEWQGFTKTVDLPKDVVVLANYQTSTECKDTYIVSRMYIDGKEMTATRSSFGNTAYCTTAGLYVGKLSKGMHTFSVKYRTPGKRNFFQNDGGTWQTRALSVVQLPWAKHYSVNPMTSFTVEESNAWQDFPGLKKRVNLLSDRVVIAAYQISGPGSVGRVDSRMWVNDMEARETRSSSANVKYFTALGVYIGRLAKGSHTFKVQYRMNSTGGQWLAGGSDWQTRALNVVVLGPASVFTNSPSAASSLLEEHLSVSDASEASGAYLGTNVLLERRAAQKSMEAQERPRRSYRRQTEWVGEGNAVGPEEDDTGPDPDMAPSSDQEPSHESPPSEDDDLRSRRLASEVQELREQVRRLADGAEDRESKTMEAGVDDGELDAALPGRRPPTTWTTTGAAPEASLAVANASVGGESTDLHGLVAELRSEITMLRDEIKQGRGGDAAAAGALAARGQDRGELPSWLLHKEPGRRRGGRELERARRTIHELRGQVATLRKRVAQLGAAQLGAAARSADLQKQAARFVGDLRQETMELGKQVELLKDGAKKAKTEESKSGEDDQSKQKIKALEAQVDLLTSLERSRREAPWFQRVPAYGGA